MIDERFGMQTGFATQALSNTVPRAAKESRCGVRTASFAGEPDVVGALLIGDHEQHVRAALCRHGQVAHRAEYRAVALAVASAGCRACQDR